MDRGVHSSLKIAVPCRASHLSTLLILLVIPSLAVPASITARGTLSWFTYDMPAAISFVQAASATPQMSTTAVSVSYPSAQTLGDMNIVVVGWNDTTATVQSVTDTAGNGYKLAIGPTIGTAVQQSIFYAPNIAGGGNTVTVTFSQAAAYPDIRILEYSGVNALDVTAGASGSSTSASSGPGAATSATELIFGADTTVTATAAAGSGFTARIITSPDSDLAEDMITTTAASNAATATLGSAGPWVMQMATFAAISAPTVTSVSPNNGLTGGGTVVTITGTNFASGAMVTFGGTAATNVEVVNRTTITATTPAGAAGAVTVTVANSGGQSGSLGNGFTYVVPGAISFVQAASATPQTPSATVSVSYSSAETLGDMNIVVVGWNDTTATVQSVTDSAGNAYKLAIGPTSGTALRQSIYYSPNIAAGSDTVTVAFSQAAISPDIRILEYSGVNALDVTAGTSGSGTNASSGSATTAIASELIFGADTIATTTTAAGSGFTARIITSPDSDLAEDMITTTASNAATATLGSSGPWVMQMATFAAISAPAPTPSLAVSPTGLSFGYVTDGSSATLPVTLTSVGTAPVIINSASISGGDYTFTGASFPVTLNPQLAITLEIAFTPTDSSSDLATLTISSNSSSSPTATVSLSGTGQSALYEVDLGWNAPTNSTDPVVGYNIYRATGSSSSYQLLNNSVNAPTNFTDPTVQNGNAYTYYVVSVDAQGNQSDPSSTVSVTIP